MEFSEFCLHYDWDERDVWQLPGKEEKVPIELLEQHLHYPFLEGYKGNPYALLPIEVIENRDRYSEEWQRTVRADLSYPIDIVRHHKGGHWIILDGLHRLMKAYALKLTRVKVRKIRRKDFLAIAR